MRYVTPGQDHARLPIVDGMHLVVAHIPPPHPLPILSAPLTQPRLTLATWRPTPRPAPAQIPKPRQPIDLAASPDELKAAS